MAHKFTLTIELGNEDMNTPLAVAHALKDVARKVGHCPAYTLLEGQAIMDRNGNKVGEWEYENKDDK